MMSEFPNCVDCFSDIANKTQFGNDSETHENVYIPYFHRTGPPGVPVYVDLNSEGLHFPF